MDLYIGRSWKTKKNEIPKRKKKVLKKRENRAPRRFL